MDARTSTSLAFGMQLPIQALSTMFAQPWEATASVEDLAAIARCADQHRFDYVAVCDHVAIPERLAEAMSTTWYDNVATLAWLAAITSGTRLLSHVHVLAYRHPSQTAHAFATIDHLSGGRVILGVGAGHVPEEFELLGLDFADRGAILDDRIAAVKAHLEDEFVDGMGASPRPVQRPRPPLWVGGSSPAAIRRAALVGEGWLPQGPPQGGMATAIATIGELRAERGLDGPFAMGTLTPFIHVGESVDELPRGTLDGPPERIASALAAMVDVGVTHVQVRFASASATEQCEQIAAFAETVVPLLAD